MAFTGFKFIGEVPENPGTVVFFANVFEDNIHYRNQESGVRIFGVIDLMSPLMIFDTSIVLPIRSLRLSIEIYPRRSDRYSIDFTSLQDAEAIYRKRINSRFPLLSNPSA